jgi:anti-anti-sigma factor
MIDFKLDDRDGEATLKVSGELTIENAEALRRMLIQSMEGRSRLLLDLMSIESVDIAGLQLLCSAHRTAFHQQQELVFLSGIPEVLKQTVANVGYLHRENCAMDSNCRCLWWSGGLDG